MFDIKTVGGYRESATDPNGHPAGLAADFMVPLTPAGKAQGDRSRPTPRPTPSELGIDYIIWYQRIWSVARADEGWRPMEDRGSATENHLDHVAHQRQARRLRSSPVGLEGAACDEVVYPVPAQYIGTDNHNWHETGPYWSNWHTGTDFSAPAAPPSTPPTPAPSRSTPPRVWAGPQLVKVTTGAGSLTTWYAHMAERHRQPRPDRRCRRADRPGRQGRQRLRLPPPLRGPPQERLHLRPRQRRPLDLARRERLAPEPLSLTGPCDRTGA